jgi:hypothetical protein
MKKAKAQEQMKKLKKEMEKLQEIIDKPESGRWKPEEEAKYYCLLEGRVQSYNFIEKHDGHMRDWEIGNCYKTEEQAQAVVDLKKHIFKFPMPEKGDEYYNMDRTDNFSNLGQLFKEKLYQIIDYHQGQLMNIKTTSEQREERIRLLKLAYNV